MTIKNKSVVIIGSGLMANQYCSALSKIGISDVELIGRSQKSLERICKKFNFKSINQDYTDAIKLLSKKDLIIIATPIPDLIIAAKLALKYGQTNILIEKPGSLYYNQLLDLNKIKKSQKIFVAYNRLFYPNLQKLFQLVKKDGGITSCNFTFTERVHKIDFKKYHQSVYSRWGIANSLHVISMALRIIGMPKKITCIQSGKLPWHTSGSIFVGCGISKNGIPFSYNADWSSPGRWGIEVTTKKNAYRLIPLEQLYQCSRNSTNWFPIKFDKKYPNVKEGISEEILAMLTPNQNNLPNLVSLKEASEFNKVSEKIFGYS
jgi:predicted dehydrogenase